MSPVKGCPTCGRPACKRRHGRPRPERRAYSGTVEYDRVLAEVLERDGRVCCYCREPIGEDESLELAHGIAHADGGPFTAENVAPSHRRCNRSAGR